MYLRNNFIAKLSDVIVVRNNHKVLVNLYFNSKEINNPKMILRTSNYVNFFQFEVRKCPTDVINTIIHLTMTMM